MKKIRILTILFLCSPFIFLGQTQETKLADSYFDNLSYEKAIIEYKILADKIPSSYVLKKLGDSYYATLRMKEAALTYAKLFTLHQPKEAEYFFKYARSLDAIEKYDDAKYWMQKYQNIKNEEVIVEKYPVKKPNNNLSENTTYSVQNLYNINTPFSDFGVTEYKNTLLFSSPRYFNEISKDVDESNKGNFLDVYQIAKEDINENGKKKRFSKLVNDKFHESSISFSPDQNTMYFTRNNHNYGVYKVDKKGYINLKIYRAELINNSWQNIKELPFCSDHYSVGHPTVSKDGKLLYFVSDMPGSLGETDIFVVTINTDGSFGKPQNLGPKINTKKREMFPFIADDNTLYFSSDGHQGIGGLDIFESKMTFQQFQNPQNLKEPINSKSDDFAFSINATKTKGYLSSNRIGGKGDDDIYSFQKQEKDPENCKQLISGTVRNLKFQKYLPYSKLVLKDDKNNIIENTTADEFGRFSFQLPCNQYYKITGSKEYYKPATKSFSTQNSQVVDLDLEIIDDFGYNNMQEVVIKINDIYFDYDKWDIRPDAAKELDHIIDVMNKYPKIIVKSTSHTDARGKAKYNELLSQRRAESTVDYIIYNGIDPDRIYSKGFGESQLTNKCIDNDNHTRKVKCSEAQHQANRRTSFVIINIDGTKIKSKEKYRVVKY